MKQLKCELYKAKFDLIFQQVGSITNSIWKGDKWSNYVDSLIYVSYIKGQKVNVTLEFVNNRINASVHLNAKINHGFCFHKKISFSPNKDAERITQDLIYRLELRSMNEKVSLILDEREKQDLRENNERYKRELFKRVLSFNESYNGKLVTYPKDGVKIELDLYYDALEIKGDSDLLMQICCKLQEIFK